MPAPMKYVDLEIRGAIYANAQAAAERFGVDAQTVRKAARAGTLHRVGLGRCGKEPMRVRVGDRTFENAREAAAELGCTPSAVWGAVWHGDPDRLLRPRGRPGANAQTVEIGPLSFPSMAAASRALGFSHGYVSLAFRRGSRGMQERLLAAAMRLEAEGRS